ncbi:MAG: hypothetical protein WC816_01275 [Sphingomonas sp.]
MLEFIALLASPALLQATEGLGHKDASGPINICGIEAPSSTALYEKILALKDAKPIEQIDDYLTLGEDQAKRIWTLVINKHPAAPAVICRTVTDKQGGGSTIRMEVSCFASRDACDKLVRDFVEHDNKIVPGVIK